MASNITIETSAVERAVRLMNEGKDLHSACVDAAHHFKCSAELLKAAVRAHGHMPDLEEEPSPCRQHKDTGRGCCCYCGTML